MKPAERWEKHGQEWRDPRQIASWWEDAQRTDQALLQQRARGKFWEVLQATGRTLIVSREYEHLLVALAVKNGRPHVTYMRVPHPSGLAWDPGKGALHVASTRNPNQVLELQPVESYVSRAEMPGPEPEAGLLVPARSSFYRGSLYLHDLALIGGRLHGNAVGMNAVVAFESGAANPVWWPKSIETAAGARMDRNYLQLNSIAAGPTVRQSFFSASAEAPASRLPGHIDFPVDRRGVIFSGETAEVVVGGLTRPHSARLHRGELWVDNSGYGELCLRRDDSFHVVAKLPGWTRGLAFHEDIAFVGTSRILPRFEAYAPGVRPGKAICGVHAVNVKSGEILGSLVWPAGNQIFAIEALDAGKVTGLPFLRYKEPGSRERRLFYSFIINAD